MARALAWLFVPMVLSLVACGGNSFTTAADQTGGAGSGGSTGGASTGGGNTGGAGTGGTNTGGVDTGGASTGGGNTGGASAGGASTGGGNSGGAGSSGSTSVNATDFDQSCDYDSECEPVLDGDVCGCRVCSTAAVNRVALEAFNSARSAVICPEIVRECEQVSCPEPVGSCVGGSCTVRPAVVIGEAQFDATCTDDTDCQAIPAGEVCADCQCAFVAVSKDGYDQYRGIADAEECHRRPVLCDCPEPSVPICVKNGSVGSLGTCRIDP